MAEIIPLQSSSHEPEVPSYELVTDLYVPIAEVTEALLSYDALAILRPERYWSGTPRIEIAAEVSNPQGLPVEVDFDKKQKSMVIRIGEHLMEEYADGFGDEAGQTHSDLLKLFVGYAFVHDLAIRVLPPEKADDFIEHITKPNGLYAELLASGLLEKNDNHQVLHEFLIGDEDRIAKVNVARFAIGAVCEALSAKDRQFRRRITTMFRPEFETFLHNGASYRGMAEGVFDQSPDKAKEMFVEHIKDFDLAAAFPKYAREVEEFVEIYSAA